ncbi:hypothetical protein HPP92_026018 [Vanilla planifolia]|uniref:Uncharacterized protein n=1 Tax=Vanilla planifolia TaxID=51239 RepID=A0A835PGD8_VANPL|nr:hypothetical protein HPP92_026295 [Vanilla planifolia]KAG0451760.1 hypothetical protein HPP92_026018 [Vanilla planifolia]
MWRNRGGISMQDRWFRRGDLPIDRQEAMGVGRGRARSDDFRDVFRGPTERHSRDSRENSPAVDPAATIYDRIFRSAGTGVAVEGGGGGCRFRINRLTGRSVARKD